MSLWRSVRAVRARKDIISQRRSVDAEDLSIHVVVSVQRLSQTSESVADVEVVGMVELPRHLVSSAQEEEVPSELTVMTCGELHVLVPVALANLRATKRECRFRDVFEGSYISLL